MVESLLGIGGHIPKLWADEDAHNFVPSKNAMMNWTSTLDEAVVSHSKCRNFELKCTEMHLG